MNETKDEVNLRRLADKHREYDERLAALQERRFLTESEQREEANLKKLKLKVKDEMEALLRPPPERAERHG